MKILLLAHGRSGSNSLHFALSYILNLEKVIEPFNRDLWESGDYKDRQLNWNGTIQDNTIIKNLVGTNDEWVRNNITNFDKVILLVRDNIRDTMISAENAFKYGYINQYTPTENPTAESMLNVVHSYGGLFGFLHENKKSNLVWYEDIYTDYSLSKKTIQSLDLNINDNQFLEMWNNYLSPSHRLRKEDGEGNQEYPWIKDNQKKKKNDLI